MRRLTPFYAVKSDNFRTFVSTLIYYAMKDFIYYAPTRVVFGKSAEEKLPELIKDNGGSRVLVHYGGNSARRSGLLD